MNRYTTSAAMMLAVFVGASETAAAAEGAFPTYLLGTRDLAMGIVPGPGTYVSHDVTYYKGNLSAASSIAGLAVSDADLDLWVNKSAVTFVAPGKVFGGSPALSIQIPIPSVSIDVAGSVINPLNGNTITGSIDGGSEVGIGDIVVAPIVGWHAGKIHYSFAATMYLPTGSYETATIDFANRSIDAANTGKNRFAIDPTFALTYLDPATGREFSFATGVTFSAKNQASDYQTGAEFHLEATLAQRFQSGWAVGVSGGVYQQLQDDSGSGAEGITNVLNANDLRGRFFQVGPVLSYSTKIRDVDVSLTGKYFHQFGAKRMFEGDTGTIRLNVSF